jgi:hypothetical protein
LSSTHTYHFKPFLRRKATELRKEKHLRNQKGEASEEPKAKGEAYYEEPNLSEIEAIDYIVALKAMTEEPNQ